MNSTSDKGLGDTDTSKVLNIPFGLEWHEQVENGHCQMLVSLDPKSYRSLFLAQGVCFCGLEGGGMVFMSKCVYDTLFRGEKGSGETTQIGWLPFKASWSGLINAGHFFVCKILCSLVNV